MISTCWLGLALILQAPGSGRGEPTPAPAETILRVDATRTIHRLSPLIYGACIEDVNHEIYGGIDSQMIFGEGFQEPPRPVAIPGFRAVGGVWRVVGDEVHVEAGPGPKLIAARSLPAAGFAAIDVRFPTGQGGNAGLILCEQKPIQVGPDDWSGYEVSLESGGKLVLGRHRRNWEPLREVAWPIPVDAWVRLKVELHERTLTVAVDDKTLLTYTDVEHPLDVRRAGLRCWQRPARFRKFSCGSKEDDPAAALALVTDPNYPLTPGASGMWDPVRKGDVQGGLSLDPVEPFQGRQSQRITLTGGMGELGVANHGLNHWGMNIRADQPYEGVVWLRSEAPTPVVLSLEARGGNQILGSTRVETPGKTWTRHAFAITPTAADPSGRFSIKLDRPGSVAVGYALLQPGEWGRYQGLPVRRDVAEGLIDQGVTVLRYGGSMVNHPDYRWKRTIGPRDQRPSGAGWWYAHYSYGWGVPDFLNLCEAMGIVGIPAFHMGESAQDMADFVEYANGAPDTPWGRQRVRDGHPEPYHLKHLELGNEEKVDAAYFARFRPMVEAIWAKDPSIIPVVGDFAYHQVITDPDHITGSDGAASLATHRAILALARERNQEVWFDIHTSTDHPSQPDGLKPERSYIDQLARLVPEARHKVVIFEYNSGNHRMKRALSNALATLEVERIGGDRLPIACSANALQPDGQNDNGWDQGLLFLNPTRVWLQPPGHLTRMTRRHFAPLLVSSELSGPLADRLGATAKRSDDGRTLVIQVVNPGDAAVPLRVDLRHFTPSAPGATIEQMAAPLDAWNTADAPEQVVPVRAALDAAWDNGVAPLTVPPRSITIVQVPGQTDPSPTMP